MSTITAYVVPFLAGGFFLWLAFLYFGKEKYPTSTLFGIVAAFFILCSLPWFQGFAKTWFVSNINSKLRELGQQIDGVQKTTSGMQEQLSNNQKQIDEHQRELDAVQSKIRRTQGEVTASQIEITNQFNQILNLQSQLATAQTNVDIQQKKLSDVEYYVDNTYSKMTTEEISGNDSNRVCHISTHGMVFFRLDGIPIHNSVQILASQTGHGNNPLILNGFQMLNVISFNFPGNWEENWKKCGFNIQYVKDTRQTNLIQHIETTTNELVLDHVIHVPIP